LWKCLMDRSWPTVREGRKCACAIAHFESKLCVVSGDEISSQDDTLVNVHHVSAAEGQHGLRVLLSLSG
jgi:hypothetical protein